MKTAFLFFFFLIIAFTLKSHAGLPPTTLSGMDDATKTTTFNFKTPHKQSTKVTGGTLIESGNKNRLANPGFEHSTTESGWTCDTTGTAFCAVGVPLNIMEGAKSAEVSCSGGASGGTCTFYQDASTVAVGGIAQIYVYSTEASGIKTIKRVNAATALELEVTGKSEWQLMKFPGNLGSTSTGVGAVITVGVSETKTVYLDEGKVGIEDVKTDATKIESQKLTIELTSTFTGATITGALASNTGSELLSYNSGTGIYTALKKVSIIASITVKSASATPTQAGIVSSGYPAIYDNSDATANSYASVTGSYLLNQGDTLYFLSGAAGASNLQRGTILATTADNTEQFSTSADFFSTDTNTLSFKSTAIVDSDPVGTFNTYSYDGNPTPSNNKTICGSAPTQTIADMKTNGILVYTRAYNADSTCGNPARVEVKIAKAGTSLPTLSKEIYKNIASVSPRVGGSLNYYLTGSDAISFAPRITSYDVSSGVLTIDAGLQPSTVTSSYILYQDNTTQTSGYLVINAQPKKTTAVQDFGEFDYVYVNASRGSTQTIPYNTLETVIYSTEIEDTHNAYNPSTGIFTTPVGASGVYLVSCNSRYDNHTWGAGNYVTGYVYVNTSGLKRDGEYMTAGTYIAPTNSVDYVANLSDGDTVECKTQHTISGGGTANLRAGGNDNNLTITRIPGQFR